ncbi:MAG: hypothetical protein ACUVX9_03205 [Anaerolineae bacterium]
MRGSLSGPNMGMVQVSFLLGRVRIVEVGAMDRRALSITLLVTGLVAVLIALGAGLLGLCGEDGFSPARLGAAAAGAVAAAVGAGIRVLR